MKTVKILCLYITATLLLGSCSNDDNAPAEAPPTVQEMLSSGIWYWQSSTRQTVSDCNMQSYFNFIDDDTLLLENFAEDEMDNCNSGGIESIPYILLNDDEFQVEIEGELFVYTIDFIDDVRLIISAGDSLGNVTLSFEKQS